MNIIILTAFLFSSAVSDTTIIKSDSTYATNTNINTLKGNNIYNQPEWGPAGYDYAEYYYMPDIETYYSVANHQYIYLNNFKWFFSSLPPANREVDIYNCYKIVMNEQRPFLHFKEHQKNYLKHRGLKEKQTIIKYAYEEKYKNHWYCVNPKIQERERAIVKIDRKNSKWRLDDTVSESMSAVSLN